MKVNIEGFKRSIVIIEATIKEYPLIQNMARFYVYDLSKECGHISSEWALPANGLYESSDFKSYFEDNLCRAYLIKVDDEIAGFVLLNHATTDRKNEWNMGEFFILGKFQGLGIGAQVAKKIWQLHLGNWEVSVIPENKSALKFWQNAIASYTNDNFIKETKLIDFDKEQPKRVIFSFQSVNMQRKTNSVS